MADKEVRCCQCGKLIALKLEGKLEWYCPRCKHFNREVRERAQRIAIRALGDRKDKDEPKLQSLFTCLEPTPFKDDIPRDLTDTTDMREGRKGINSSIT